MMQKNKLEQKKRREFSFFIYIFFDVNLTGMYLFDSYC